MIAKYDEHIKVIQQLIDDGIPATSSISFRALSNLPDVDAAYKKIKNKITPEQKARIEEVKKKLKRVTDKFQ